MKQSTWLLSLLCAGMALPLSCFGEGVCTQRGCSDGLSLQFVGLTDEEFKVSLATDAGTLKVSCPDGTVTGDYHHPKSTPDAPQAPVTALCSPDGSIFLERFTHPTATVTVSVAGKSHKQLITPSYQPLDANGPGCEPQCRQALVTIKVSME